MTFLTSQLSSGIFCRVSIEYSLSYIRVITSMVILRTFSARTLPFISWSTETTFLFTFAIMFSIFITSGIDEEAMDTSSGLVIPIQQQNQYLQNQHHHSQQQRRKPPRPNEWNVYSRTRAILLLIIIITILIIVITIYVMFTVLQWVSMRERTIEKGQSYYTFTTCANIQIPKYIHTQYKYNYWESIIISCCTVGTHRCLGAVCASVTRQRRQCKKNISAKFQKRERGAPAHKVTEVSFKLSNFCTLFQESGRHLKGECVGLSDLQMKRHEVCQQGYENAVLHPLLLEKEKALGVAVVGLGA